MRAALERWLNRRSPASVASAASMVRRLIPWDVANRLLIRFKGANQSGMGGGQPPGDGKDKKDKVRLT